MLDSEHNFIPVMTSNAGLCLTALNWQEVKVTTASYSLESLLYKPGQEVLKKITDIKHYLGWSGAVVLNASSLIAHREGVYALKSPYDGSRIKLSAQELIELIQHLKPDAIILPKNILQDCPQFWDTWHDAIVPFFYHSDLLAQTIEREYGVYFNVSNESEFALLDQWSYRPRYVMGTIDTALIEVLRTKGISLIETDEPAKDALHGQVYSRTGNIDLMNSNTELQFEPIDPDCTCPSCSQKFTKAYFHHLLQHTPLLCQRLLIQHNVFWMAK